MFFDNTLGATIKIIIPQKWIFQLFSVSVSVFYCFSHLPSMPEAFGLVPDTSLNNEKKIIFSVTLDVKVCMLSSAMGWAVAFLNISRPKNESLKAGSHSGTSCGQHCV